MVNPRIVLDVQLRHLSTGELMLLTFSNALCHTTVQMLTEMIEMLGDKDV